MVPIVVPFVSRFCLSKYYFNKKLKVIDKTVLVHLRFNYFIEYAFSHFNSLTPEVSPFTFLFPTELGMCVVIPIKFHNITRIFAVICFGTTFKLVSIKIVIKIM